MVEDWLLCAHALQNSNNSSDSLLAEPTKYSNPINHPLFQNYTLTRPKSLNLKLFYYLCIKTNDNQTFPARPLHDKSEKRNKDEYMTHACQCAMPNAIEKRKKYLWNLFTGYS